MTAAQAAARAELRHWEKVQRFTERGLSVEQRLERYLKAEQVYWLQEFVERWGADAHHPAMAEAA